MWYKCFIKGENFPGELIGHESLVGFYTTRYVEAFSIEEAESKVLENLRSESSLKLPDGVKPVVEAKVFFESIEEVSRLDAPTIKLGFTFYPMES